MENKAYALFYKAVRFFYLYFGFELDENIGTRNTCFISYDANNNILCLIVKKTLNETK